MRRLTTMLTAAAVVLTTSGAIAQARPNFAGEWKLVAGGAQGEPGVDLIIGQTPTSMTVEYRRGGPGPGRVTLTYQLDGSPSRNAVGIAGSAATEQVSKASWAGNTLVVTTATSAGDERRTFAITGADLVIETSAPAPKGAAPSTVTSTYKRYQRGFGG